MPSLLWPWSHYDRALQRSHVVLARMREEGFITAQAEQQARATPPRILSDPGLNRGAAGYAQDYLRQQFKAVFEDDNPPDWKVRTTFVPALQREAERAVTQGLAKFRQAGLQAALVVIDPQTGDVLALVGGRDYRRSAFNRATGAKRQPGSAFKPFLYAAALESGMSPISPLSNLNEHRVPGHDEWEVKNASIDTRDTLTLREALFESNNQAAVKLQTQIGSRPVLRMAQSVGLPPMPDVPSLALGVGEATPLELTAAYAVFPNGGFAVTPRPILQVLDNDGYAVLNRAVAAQARHLGSDRVSDGVDARRRRGYGNGRGGALARRALPRRRQNGHDRRFQGRVVRRLLIFARRGRVGGLRQARRRSAPTATARDTRCRSGPTSCRRPRASASLRNSACRRRSTRCGCASVSHMVPRETCPTYTEYFKHGDLVPDDKCDVHRGPNAAEVIGGVLSRIGKGIGKIFGR